MILIVKLHDICITYMFRLNKINVHVSIMHNDF